MRYGERMTHGRTLASTFLAGALLVAISLSCRKAEPPPPAAAPAKPAIQESLKPGLEFTDAGLQRQYEAAWRQHIEWYQSPPTGTLMYVRLNDGSFVGGTVQRWSDTNLVLKDGRVVRDIARDDLAPEVLPDVYLAPFLQKYALDTVTALPATSTSAVRLRYSLTDYPEPRVGPGPRYRLAEGVSIDKGTTLEVLEERGLWIRVRPQHGNDAAFWVNRFTTIPAPGMPPEDAGPILAQLLETGYLAGFNVERNEALVPKQAWIGTDTSVQEGMARVLAAHVTRLRTGSVDWIEIKDVENGRRLARYSQAQGYRAQ